MALKSNENAILKVVSTDQRLNAGQQNKAITRNLNIGSLVPADGYVVDEKHKNNLKESIRLSGLLTPLTVRPVSNGKFEIISGHHRWSAMKELREESDESRRRFEMVACLIEEVDDITARHNLYSANADARKLMPFEILEQIETDYQFYDKLREEGKLDPSKSAVDYVCEFSRISRAEFARRRYTREHLVYELKKLLFKYFFPMSAAHLLATLSPEVQRMVAEAIIQVAQTPTDVDISVNAETKTALTIKEVEEIVAQVNRKILSGAEDAAVVLPSKGKTEDAAEAVKPTKAASKMTATEKFVMQLDKQLEATQKLRRKLDLLLRKDAAEVARNRTKTETIVKSIRSELRDISKLLEKSKQG